MKFYYSISIDKDVDIDFKDIYNIQIDDYFHSHFDFNQNDIESAKDYLSDDFGDNIEYYLHRIGLVDYNDCDNESISDCIWQEYSDWLDDNYNPSDFECLHERVHL